MKVHTSIVLALLSLGALAAAQGEYVPFPYNRHGLDPTDPSPYRDMHVRPIDYTRPAVYRRSAAAILVREAVAEAMAKAWAPEVKGKYVKDTLKCDKHHVCSGEIVVAA